MVEPATTQVEVKEGLQEVVVNGVTWYAFLTLNEPVDNILSVAESYDLVKEIETCRFEVLSRHRAHPSEHLIQATYGLDTAAQYVRAYNREQNHNG